MAKSAVKPSVDKNDALLWTVLLFGAIMGSYLIYGLMDPMGDFGRCCPGWRAWTPILEQWELLPTFLFIEYGAILFTMGTLVHAYQSGPEYLLVWLSSFLTGSANGAVLFASHGHALAAVSVGVQGATPLVADIFFMAIDMGNFWQAHATIMLTPRLPLYIPCMYNVFMYPAVVASWRLSISPLAQAALAGLAGEIIYAPYDIVGIKFLWWTWDEGDPAIRSRFAAPTPIRSIQASPRSRAIALVYGCTFVSRPALRSVHMLARTGSRQVGVRAGSSACPRAAQCG